MYFILAILVMLSAILVNATVRISAKFLLPFLWNSNHTAHFKQRLSIIIRELFVDIVREWYTHLKTICEPEGEYEDDDELDLDRSMSICKSPLWYPTCDHLKSPPKETLEVDESNNGTTTTGNVGGNQRLNGRRRIPIPRILHNNLGQGPIGVPPQVRQRIANAVHVVPAARFP